jgi:hypothetical protein
MKRNVRWINTLLLLISISTLSFGQSIQLSDSSGILTNGAEVTILRNPVASQEIPCVFFVQNLTGGDIEINVARTNLSTVANTDNYFCWGACYPPFVDTGSVYVNIPKAKTDSTFIAHYTYENPLGVFNEGTSRVQYTFYNTADMTDAVTVVVNYVCGYASIEELADVRFLGKPYPNPADQGADIYYNIPLVSNGAEIVIRSISGIEVMRVGVGVGSGTAHIDVSKLPSGIYLYSLDFGNKIVFRSKLIVQHS